MSLRLRLALSYLLVVALFLLTLGVTWGLLVRKGKLAQAHAGISYARRLAVIAGEAASRGGWEGAAAVLGSTPLPEDTALVLFPPEGPPRPLQGSDHRLVDAKAVARARKGQLVSRLRGGADPDRRAALIWVPVRGRGALGISFRTALPPEVRGPVQRAFLVSAATAAAVAFGTGLLLASFISGPVRRLAAASEALGAGVLSTRVKVTGTGELRDLAVTFNRMAGRLEEMERARREFLADISHTLRTPLTAIQGWTEALADGLGQGEEPHYLERIHRETLFLSRTVERLLDLSRWEGGVPGLKREEVELSGPLMEAAESLGPAAEARGISLRLEGPVASCRVLGDPVRLRELFQALLENAVEHAGEGASVRVSVVPSGGEVEVEVADDGKGIDPQILPRLFERFGRSGGKGVGLGLAIARRIAEAHGSTLEVESHPGEGAVFRFRLPTSHTE